MCLQHLPMDEIQGTVQQTLQGVFQTPLGLEVARRGLLWAAHAIRPLTVSELRSSLSCTVRLTTNIEPGMNNDSLTELCASILRFLTLTDFRNLNFERQSLVIENSGCSEMARLPLAHEVHEAITISCLSEIMRRDPRNALIQEVSHAHDFGICDSESFSNYAATYWKWHYKLAEPKSQILPGILSRVLQIHCQRSSSGVFKGQQKTENFGLKICSTFQFDVLGAIYLQTGADPNDYIPATGETALHIAAAQGNCNFVKILVDYGAELEARTLAAGETALHLAAKHGQIDVVDLLLTAGCDPIAICRKGGFTASELAAVHGHTEIVEHLSHASASTCESEDIIFEYLSRAGSGIESGSAGQSKVKHNHSKNCVSGSNSGANSTPWACKKPTAIIRDPICEENQDEDLANSRPLVHGYACCGWDRTFTSKNDWKRHESTHRHELGFHHCGLNSSAPDCAGARHKFTAKIKYSPACSDDVAEDWLMVDGPGSPCSHQVCTCCEGPQPGSGPLLMTSDTGNTSASEDG